MLYRRNRPLHVLKGWKLKAAAALLVVSVAMSSTAIGQTYYKCKTPSGGTAFSDAPCSGGDREQQVFQGSVQAYPNPREVARTPDRETSMLDAKVAEALATRDFSKAKSLAVTEKQWQMVSDAEQRYERRDDELRAESRRSQDCERAQWSYDLAAGSNSSTGATIGAAKRRMYSACGMREPDTTTTIINNNPSPRNYRYR
ncbi:DUF4124 domain-containing protein [Accumulibacter sp.]|uniref:DUF4124 domain-containing protein n=1 Tax=Accumulibacter sp. TaxID=2053492 RepID=UPI0035AEB209